MTDEEWGYFEPFLRQKRGRPPRDHRLVLDAVFCTMRAGIAVAGFASAVRRVEFHLASIPPLGGKRRLGRDPGGPRRKRSFRFGSPNDRRDDHPGAPLRSRRKRGIQRNALGGSRGGFSTKINARTNPDGLPIGFVSTPGQAHDVTAYQVGLRVAAIPSRSFTPNNNPFCD